LGSGGSLAGTTLLELDPAHYATTKADQIDITGGSLVLGGTVSFASLSSGYAIGQTYHLLTGSVSGSFSNNVSSALPALTGMRWNTSNFYSSGDVSITTLTSAKLSAGAAAGSVGTVTVTGGGGKYDFTPATIAGGAVTGAVDIVNGGGSGTVDIPTIVLLDLRNKDGSTISAGELSSIAASLVGVDGITTASSTDPLLTTYGYKLTNGSWDMLLTYNVSTPRPSNFKWDFTALNGGSDVSVYSVGVVPEPSTAAIALGLSGILALGGRRRGRRPA
jgi:hypothetical protein